MSLPDVPLTRHAPSYTAAVMPPNPFTPSYVTTARGGGDVSPVQCMCAQSDRFGQGSRQRPCCTDNRTDNGTRIIVPDDRVRHAEVKDTI
ncbi:hypothetical protein GCM10010495_11990 [Kitasatospora herbaricolor]|nr:hypothetical protein GCM10010495_11990 [Kitasatospora herbaricolor]